VILENGTDDELQSSFLFGADDTILRWLTLLYHGDHFLKPVDPEQLFRWDIVEGKHEIIAHTLSSTEAFRTWMHFGSLVLWYGVPVTTTFMVLCPDGHREWFYEVTPPRRPRDHDSLWAEIDRLLPDAPACDQCKLRSYLVKPAPIMTAYATGPQPQPPLCPECTEDWVYQWDIRWAEYEASRG